MKKSVFLFSLLLLSCLSSGSEFERDLIIYGNSPAALAAAIQAKRMGQNCLIVSPEKRIGGLTTGGLGRTDIGDKRAFGGISLEFYQAVFQWYQDEAHWTHQKRSEYRHDVPSRGKARTDSMWSFEPSAALAILEGWMKRDHIEIHRGKRLNRAPGKVRLSDEKPYHILSFETEDGTLYRARVFIDATYEGDLMAAAGVSYTVGREDNARYNETINGTVLTARGTTDHSFLPCISAYRIPGDKSSGLLPGIEPYDPNLREGVGDKRVQAYCFRMCLTDDPQNRIPFERPANYQESMYELLFRQLARLESLREKDVPSAQRKRLPIPWNNSPMPNRKTDTNNTGGFSTDFIGANWNWPEASYAERDKILAAHLAYQQGLMWTLANHPRVPEEIRQTVSRWGTCKDEFQDGLGNGWQRQLYVREARRLVGEMVMTEHHCRGTKIASRPIAMGTYQMDSHHCRRIETKEGFVRNEGNVEDPERPDGQDFQPYGIDYGAIIPQKKECTNLFVPVCLSASHVAFGSIRMEPVFFALGQAAGAAAVLTLEHACAVQDLPYADLERVLLKGHQVLR